MRASTLFLATWLIWITAKGRLADYWALATVSVGDTAADAPGAAGSMTHTMPAAPGSSFNPLKSLKSLPDLEVIFE